MHASLSEPCATLSGMTVSPDTLAKVPAENLRVSRAEFGALWGWAERLGDQPARGDQYLIGVLWTCRWLAGQPIWSRVMGRWEAPAAPLTRRRHAAMPETIEAEYMAALTARAFERERARGVAAALAWAWYGSGQPPLEASSATVG
jgi:hypothetical protein